MKAFVYFWKKDFINKLIVLVSVALMSGAFFVAYLLMNMKSDSIFYTVFATTLDKNGIPTMAVGPALSASETSIVFATNTPIPAQPTPAPSTTDITTENALTITPDNPTATAVVVLPSASPTMAQNTPVPSQSASDVAACIPAKPLQTGKVLDVIDGNTVKVLIDGIAYTVRYIGIDVPSYKPVAEYFGRESDFKNAEYVFAEQVTLFSDAQDKDEVGRLLRYVKVGDIFVNYELVRQGFATADTGPSACAPAFKAAEQVASQSKIGMWEPTPTLPSP